MTLRRRRAEIVCRCDYTGVNGFGSVSPVIFYVTISSPLFALAVTGCVILFEFYIVFKDQHPKNYVGGLKLFSNNPFELQTCDSTLSDVLPKLPNNFFLAIIFPCYQPRRSKVKVSHVIFHKPS